MLGCIYRFDPPISNGGSIGGKTMFNVDAISRTHFTKKDDGKNSFYEFLKAIGVLDLGLEYKFGSNVFKNGKECMFVAESWGGYDGGHGVWIVFASWRCAATKSTKYVRWDWDAVGKKAYNLRWNEWVN